MTAGVRSEGRPRRRGLRRAGAFEVLLISVMGADRTDRRGYRRVLTGLPGPAQRARDTSPSRLRPGLADVVGGRSHPPARAAAWWWAKAGGRWPLPPGPAGAVVTPRGHDAMTSHGKSVQIGHPSHALPAIRPLTCGNRCVPPWAALALPDVQSHTGAGERAGGGILWGRFPRVQPSSWRMMPPGTCGSNRPARMASMHCRTRAKDASPYVM